MWMAISSKDYYHQIDSHRSKWDTWTALDYFRCGNLIETSSTLCAFTLYGAPHWPTSMECFWIHEISVQTHWIEMLHWLVSILLYHFYVSWMMMLLTFISKGVSELLGVLFAYTFIIDNSRKWLWSGLLNILVGFIVIFVFLISSARKLQSTDSSTLK